MSNPIIKAEHLVEYQNLADEERALIALAADATGVNSLSNNVGYWNASGVFTTIFTPSLGAFDPRMVASRDFGYFLDGAAADQQKWNLNQGLSKWGISAPLTAPSVAATSGSTDAWTANVEYTTFGLLTDSNNNIQQLQSTNADNSNPAPSHIGTSGVGQPAWASPGGSTVDNTVTWLNRGPIALWTPSTFYSNTHPLTTNFGTVAHPGVIYDPDTDSIYFNNNASGNPGTTGTTRPSFTGINGQIIADNGGDNGTGIAWRCIHPTSQVWAQSHAYTTYASGVPINNFQNTTVVEPTTTLLAFNQLTQTFSQTIFFQTVQVAGTSAATGTSPAWATSVGGFTSDGQLLWQNEGSKTWVAATPYTRWQGAKQPFSVILDTNGNYQVCFVSGTSGGSQPTWLLNYGDQTQDGGTLIWVNLGPAASWAASTKWFMGANGWSVPTAAGSYTGSTILDSNGDLETVKVSGKSGAGPAPTWNGPGQTTTDNTITWFNIGLAPTGAGSVSLISPVGRQYFLVFTNSASGGISDLGPVSAGTGALTNGQVFLGQLAVSSDPQVDQKILLATADGGDQTTLYFVAELPNATRTFVDTTEEAILLAQAVYQETDASGVEHGVADNTPPPNGSFPLKYRGRLYMLVGSFLFFSKSLADLTTSTGVIAGRYEECWPADFQTDISEGAEIGRGLFTDGYVLYIGTQRHIRRIQGDGPTNFTSPEVIFNEVGINNQDVWQPIFMEGTPAGSMWLTPDFRVIRSDFNTYQNVGTEIQTTLNTTNAAAANACWASYVGINGYNFYVLAIPTGANTEPDTLCVYNIATNKWFIWSLADLLRCGLFYLNLAGIPRFVVNANDGSIYIFDPSVSMDRATGVDKTGITSTIRTVFTDMYDATLRKALNEVEVGTTQTGMKVTVEGASSAQEFANPNVVVSNGALIKNIFGNYKLFLAGLFSQDRFYRMTLTDTSNTNSTVNDELLNYYSFEAVPLHRN